MTLSDTDDSLIFINHFMTVDIKRTLAVRQCVHQNLQFVTFCFTETVLALAVLLPSMTLQKCTEHMTLCINENDTA